MGWLAFLRRWFTPRQEREPEPAASSPRSLERTPAPPAPPVSAHPPTRPTPPPQTPVQRGAPTIVPPKASQVVRPVDRAPANPPPATRAPAAPAQERGRAAAPATEPPPRD